MENEPWAELHHECSKVPTALWTKLQESLRIGADQTPVESRILEIIKWKTIRALFIVNFASFLVYTKETRLVEKKEKNRPKRIEFSYTIWCNNSSNNPGMDGGGCERDKKKTDSTETVLESISING